MGSSEKSDLVPIILEIHHLNIWEFLHFDSISFIVDDGFLVPTFHIAESQSFLSFIPPTDIIAWRNMNDSINTGIIIHIDLILIEFLHELIQNFWVNGEVDGVLTIDPMGEQMVEIRE